MEEFFACPVAYDAAEPEICFALDDAHRRSAYAQPAVVSAMRVHADSLLARLGASRTLAYDVATLVQQADLRGASAEATAEALGLSVRTLYRRLKEEGDTYQAIVDRVRHQRCLARLEYGDASASELSPSLGFAETSSFYRAFRRWTNRSFAQFRAEHGG